MAGIIPLNDAGSNNYRLLWPDYMMPLTENYIALQRSIAECAMIGCGAIWIVTSEKIAPIVQKHIGDFIIDPNYYRRHIHENGPEYHYRYLEYIPIFFISLKQKDREHKGGVGWEIYYAVQVIKKIGDKISRFAIPEKFYVSFPNQVYNIASLYHYRPLLWRENFQIMCKEKELGFSFSYKDFGRFKINIDNKLYDYSATIKKGKHPFIFSLQDLIERDMRPTVHIEMPWSYDITDWDGYRKYCASFVAKKIKRPELDWGKKFEVL